MFRMNFVNFNSFFDLQVKVYTLLGINIHLPESKQISLKTKRTTIIYCIFCYTLYAINTLLCILYIIISDEKLEKKISVFMNIYAQTNAIFKFYFIYNNLGKIENALRNLSELYDQKDLNKMVDKENFIRKASFNQYLIKFFIFITPTLYLMPLVATISGYLKLGIYNPTYPIVLWCPFESMQYYLPFYIFVYYAALTMTFNMTAADSTFFMLLTHITQHLKELSKDFEELMKHERMAVLVDRHNLLLE